MLPTQLVAYTYSTESIPVVWEGYMDDESGIKSFNVRLVEAASCDVGDSDNLTSVHNQEWLVLGPDIRDFKFVDLSLVVSLFSLYFNVETH